MPLFTSARERRLWAGTLAVVVAIFSTLGLANSLAPLLGSGVGGALFVLAIPVIVATVVTQGLRIRPGGVEIVVALGIVASYLLVLSRMATPIERSHLMEYGVLAVFIHEALAERASHRRPVLVPGVAAVLIATIVGVLDETIQVFLPSRVFDPVDILFNSGAAVMAVAASLALAWARRRSGLARGRNGDSGTRASA